MSNNSLRLHVVLYEPEIPPNTGNLIRLCANTGVQLHLVKPLGFSMDTKALRRAGLDYHESARVNVHEDIEQCFEALGVNEGRGRVFALSTHGTQLHTQPSYQLDDILLFGPETRGLPSTVREDKRVHRVIRVPMKTESRSLNLSNAVAIVAFEALRQLDFPELS